MSVAPAPGDIYNINNPPFPSDFNGMGVSNGILTTCYAVTAGPNRNLYWIYDDMKSSDTAIQTNVPRGTCFETRDSIAVSQQRTALTDTCATCRRTIGTHMTATQATTAFATHATSFPATLLLLLLLVLSILMVWPLLLVLLHQSLLLVFQ